MNCQNFLQLYSEYADGRLADPRAVAHVHEHLERCARCAHHVESLERGLDVLRSGDVSPSPTFRSRLSRRLRSEVAIGDPIVPTSAGLAAALLLATGLGLFLYEASTPAAEEIPTHRAARLAPMAFDTIPPPLEEIDVTLPPFTQSTLQFLSSQDPLDVRVVLSP